MKKLLTLTLTLALLATAGFAQSKKQREINRLESINADLTQQLCTANSCKNDLESQVSDLNKKIKELKEDLEREVTSEVVKYAELQERLLAIEAEAQKEKEALIQKIKELTEENAKLDKVIAEDRKKNKEAYGREYIPSQNVFDKFTNAKTYGFDLDKMYEEYDKYLKKDNKFIIKSIVFEPIWENSDCSIYKMTVKMTFKGKNKTEEYRGTQKCA